MPVKIKLAELFDIDLWNKFIGNGMDAVVLIKSSNYEGVTNTYFCFHEYSHSYYQISLRGLAHIGN